MGEPSKSGTAITHQRKSPVGKRTDKRADFEVFSHNCIVILRERTYLLIVAKKWPVLLNN